MSQPTCLDTHAPTAARIEGFALIAQVRDWARALGFSQIGVAGVDLRDAEPGLLAWLEQGFHGTMGYMALHGLRRARPAELVPGTVSVITARIDYLPRDTAAHAPGDWQAQEVAQLQRSDEHTSEHQSRPHLVRRLLDEDESWQGCEANGAER